MYVVSLVWPSHRAFFTPGQMQVQTPAGPMMVQVPADKKPGDMFTFMVPAPAMPQQPVMAVGQVIQPQVAPQMAVAGYPAGYPATGQQVAGYPATGQQVMMVQPVVAMAPVRHVTHFNRVSTMATCMHCQHTGPTVVQYDPGCGAWLMYCALSNMTGPAWPASAAQAADWPRLVGAWGSRRLDLAPKGPPESQLAEA